MSPEQLARVEENRLKALEKRKAALARSQAEQARQEVEFQVELEQKLNEKPEPVCLVIQDDGSTCSKKPVVPDLFENFDECVCHDCKAKAGDDYRLISRAECMSQYLLPEDTVKCMKSQKKNNPHHAGWTPMRLYLRKHAINLSIQRFGSVEALEVEKKKRSTAKFEKTLKETENILSKSSEESRQSLTGKKKTAAGLMESEDKGDKKKARDGAAAKRRKIISGFVSCILGEEDNEKI